MTPEEELIQCYFDAFNSHDIEGVMACFHENAVMVDATGTRFEGREEVRRHYENRIRPDARLPLRSPYAHREFRTRSSGVTFPRYTRTVRGSDRGHWR